MDAPSIVDGLLQAPWLTPVSQYLGAPPSSRRLVSAEVSTINDRRVCDAIILSDRNTRRINSGTRVKIQHVHGAFVGVVEATVSLGRTRRLIIRIQV